MCFLCLLCLLCLLCVPAHAQFVGFTSPQTSTRTVLSAVAAPTASTTVTNAGQVSHWLTYVTSGAVTSLSLQLEGSFDGTNWLRISEPSTNTTSGITFAHIYLPLIRANLTAMAGGGTVTVYYSGASAAADSFSPSIGGSPVNPYFFDGSAWQRVFGCTNRANISLSGAGNTQLVAASSAQNIRVCHLSISFVSMVDFSLHEGTGVNCATGDTAITGTYQDVLTLALDFSTEGAVRSSLGVALCANLGTAVTGGGVITYAQF